MGRGLPLGSGDVVLIWRRSTRKSHSRVTVSSSAIVSPLSSLGGSAQATHPRCQRSSSVALVRGPHQRGRVLGLIETDFAPARKLDLRYRAPPYVLHLRTPDVLLTECRDDGLQIVRHEIELVPDSVVGRMDSQFRRRQGEYQPIMTSIHR